MSTFERELSNKEMDALCRAFLSLKNVDECKRFLRDVCTLSELTAMIERLQVAGMVREETPYRAICEKTGVSTATITRVAHWYNYGMGGYKLVLDRAGK